MITHDINYSEQLTTCLISGGPVVKILDFGQHAYADTFVSPEQLNLSEPIFPLQVYLNPTSGSIQLKYISNADARYNLYSYSYTSSNSNTAMTHWNNYASWVKENFNTNGLVVEIGSNDGYLIGQFKNDLTTPVGIDSSYDMCKIASERGVTVVEALFDSVSANQLLNEHGYAKVIMANNVFNHANNPVAFAQAVSELLDPDTGVFIFEVPYWLSMIESGRFTDMVYHEHPSYFTIKSIWNLLKVAGLEIIDFSIVDYHGGSLRVVAQRDHNNNMPIVVEDAIQRETMIGLFTPEFYYQTQKRFESQRDAWLYNFYQLRLADPGGIFIGVGAAAKANTWLTWHGLNKTHLHCITDSSKFKQGKYTPLSRIPILDDTEFAHHPNPYALILSWNIGPGLKQALLSINPNTRFLNQ